MIPLPDKWTEDIRAGDPVVLRLEETGVILINPKIKGEKKDDRNKKNPCVW